MRVNKLSLAVLAGATLYGVVYFMASHGDAFKFAERTIRNSRSLETRIGKVDNVRIPLFSPYRERFFNSEASAAMTVEVTGAMRTVELKLKMKKTNDHWMVEHASLDGAPVILN